MWWRPTYHRMSCSEEGGPGLIVECNDHWKRELLNVDINTFGKPIQ